MSRYLVAVLRCSICAVVLSIQMFSQVSRRVDLREWGYRPPESATSHFQVQLPSQIVSIGKDGGVVVGFVTRDRTGLATRDLPPLSLHVIRFATNGKFLSQGTIPTPSWHENAIFVGNGDTLLIRTGTRLYLFSSNMERLADKDLSATPNSVLTDWRIYPLPSRNSFLLYNYLRASTSIALLNWRDLRSIKECPYSPYDRVLAVSNKNILSIHPSLAKNPLRRTVELSEICGPSNSSYSWEGDPTNAALIDDGGLILAGGGSSIISVVDNKVRWTEMFDKKFEIVSNHIEVSADGRLLAAAIKKLGGGNRLLDISRSLRSIKIIVYQADTGKRTVEVSVTPTPSSVFDFALSPEGDSLAVVSDGYVEIVPLKQ